MKNRPAHPIVMRGMMTGVRYMDDILDIYVRPYAADAIRSQFILMDDNARPHRARVVEEYLQRETIVRMDWPDLNPIEHVWNMPQMAISRRPRNREMQSLKNGTITMELAAIQRLIGSKIRPLANRDCIMRITNKLLTVVVASKLTVRDSFMTRSDILKLPYTSFIMMFIKIQ